MTKLPTFNDHENARQTFIVESAHARDLIASGNTRDAHWAILRANAAVAQGMVYADLLGVTNSGWIDRMCEIMHLMGECEKIERWGTIVDPAA